MLNRENPGSGKMTFYARASAGDGGENDRKQLSDRKRFSR